MFGRLITLVSSLKEKYFYTKEIDFNTTHPELRDGEMWLTNIYTAPKSMRFDSIGWESKRKGTTAYNIYGEVLSYMLPVFVNKKEWKEGMARQRKMAKN